jgi:hypothetical protein
MKIHKKILTGSWFGFGVVLTNVLVLLHLHVPIDRTSMLGIGMSLGIGTIVGTYCGRVWGVVIIQLGTKKTSDIWRAIGYGLLIGLITFFAIIFMMTLVSFFQTKFMDLLQQDEHLKIIISLIKIPVLALFGTLMGCILEPLVLLMSGLGGGLLYLLRRQVLRLSQGV